VVFASISSICLHDVLLSAIQGELYLTNVFSNDETKANLAKYKSQRYVVSVLRIIS
jgi:hypothetical protein